MRTVAFVLFVVATLACKTPPTPPSSTPDAAAPSAPAAPTVSLKDLQGKWKVASSSGDFGKGQVFRDMVGEVLVVAGDRLSVPDHAFIASGAPVTFQMTKKITLVAGTNPQAIDLDQTPDAQGWSRVGVVTVVGDVMTLSVNFPNLTRPEDLLPGTDGREVVTLERVKP